MLGRARTGCPCSKEVMAVVWAYCACRGADGGCLDIFLWPIIFFFPLSGMDRWVTCDFSFSYIRMMDGCNGIPFKIVKIPASSRARIRDR